MTKIAFDAFSCYQFEEGDLTTSNYLKADVAIECYTEDHQSAKRLAWLAICLFPIGLLLVNGGLLFGARRAILSGSPTPLSRATAFLYTKYPQAGWRRHAPSARLAP